MKKIKQIVFLIKCNDTFSTIPHVIKNEFPLQRGGKNERVEAARVRECGVKKKGKKERRVGRREEGKKEREERQVTTNQSNCV